MTTPLAGSTARKKRLNLLIDSISRVRMDISIKRIHNWQQVFEFLGQNNRDIEAPLTIDNFNKLVAFPLEAEFRKVLAKEAEDERLGIKKEIKGLVTSNLMGEKPSPILPVPSDIEIVEVGKSHHAHEHPVDSTEWSLKSTHPCTLYTHQTKAVKDLLFALHVEDKRAALLQAAVGTGKTFIYGKYLKELWARNWFFGKTFSPWPVLVITKASICEQTRRVLANQFELIERRQFKVLNYDALRSKKGLDTMIREEIVHQGGEKVRLLQWVQGIEPLVFIIDECQSAKNERSMQSQIIQRISLLPNPNIKIIFSSATPFQRVVEAKYLCVNLGMEYSLTA